MNPAIADLFAQLTHGVYVVGVAAGDRRNVFTAAWVMQVSFDPPMLALAINPAHSSYLLLERGRGFSVNVLAADRLDLARHCGQPASADKLAALAWRPAPSGAPILDAASAWFECRLDGSVAAGDHRVVTATVVGGAVQRTGAEPLLYRATGALDGSAALYPDAFPAR